MASMIKRVFSERNILVLSFCGIMVMTFEILNFEWMSLFQLELGATPEIVGTIAMIRSGSMLFFQLPGGMLADKFGRRNLIVLGGFLRIGSPLIFIFARTWQHLIPGLILGAIGMSISMPASQALIAESLPHDARGAGFGAYRMVTMLPMVYMPIVGGIIMDCFGVIEGMRMVFHLALAAEIVAAMLKFKFVKETMSAKVADKGPPPSLTFKESLCGLSIVRGSLLAMSVMSVFSTFTMQLIMPFRTIYAVNVKGFTKTQWGLVGTVMGLISTILSLPGGMISDRFGRRPLILIARVMMPINNLGLVLLPEFNQILLLNIGTSIGNGLGGEAWGPMGGPAWQALITDLAPSEERARVMGFIATLSGVAGLPASVSGGYLYNDIGPDQPFLAAVLISLFPIFLMYFIKEPKIREK